MLSAGLGCSHDTPSCGLVWTAGAGSRGQAAAPAASSGWAQQSSGSHNGRTAALASVQRTGQPLAQWGAPAALQQARPWPKHVWPPGMLLPLRSFAWQLCSWALQPGFCTNAQLVDACSTVRSPACNIMIAGGVPSRATLPLAARTVAGAPKAHLARHCLRRLHTAARQLAHVRL